MHTPKKKKLDHHRNPSVLSGITLEECANGVIKILENAEDLIKDAEIFIQKGKKERAVVFLVAALEEDNKLIFLISESILSTEVTSPEIKSIETKHFFKKLKNHKSKQQTGYSLRQEQLISKFRYEEAVCLAEKERPLIELGRQRGFYVDFENGKFISPKESFSMNNFFQKNFDEFFNQVTCSINRHRKVFGKDVKTCFNKLKILKLMVKKLEELKPTNDPWNEIMSLERNMDKNIKK